MAREPGGPTAIVIGLLPSVRSRLEAAFRQTVEIVSLLTQKDGGLVLLSPPAAAVAEIELVFERIEHGQRLLIIVLPYAKVPEEVLSTVKALGELGCRVHYAKPNDDSWPARPEHFDNTFQAALLARLGEAIKGEFGLRDEAPPVLDEDQVLMSEILRGLVTHSKMGPNNHSHEDDLWKSRGKGMKPNQKHRVLKRMLHDGLLDCKQNDSMGGRGWVYWIADVRKVRERFPELEPYF